MFATQFHYTTMGHVFTAFSIIELSVMKASTQLNDTTSSSNHHRVRQREYEGLVTMETRGDILSSSYEAIREEMPSEGSLFHPHRGKKYKGHLLVLTGYRVQ